MVAGGDISLQGRQSRSAVLIFRAGGTLSIETRMWGGAELSGDQGVLITAPINGLDTVVDIASSAGDIRVDGNITAARALDVTAHGDIVFNGKIRSADFGANLTSDAGNVTLNAPVLLREGGALKVLAAGTATLNSSVSAGTCCPGVGVDAASIVVTRSAALRSNPGGLQCLKATAGDLRLDGRFYSLGGSLHPSGGTILGSATGNVIADGVFRAAPGGCISFSAGGNVNTGGGSFDPALSPSCSIDCTGFP